MTPELNLNQRVVINEKNWERIRKRIFKAEVIESSKNIFEKGNSGVGNSSEEVLG